MEQHSSEEDSLTFQEEIGELVLAYLPPIANSEGYECRGTVAERLAEVLMEEIIKPLTDAHCELLAANIGGKIEWQVRMPEDRNSEDGWQNNVEAGALYLEREHGAEVRTRVVSEWYVRGEK